MRRQRGSRQKQLTDTQRKLLADIEVLSRSIESGQEAVVEHALALRRSGVPLLTIAKAAHVSDSTVLNWTKDRL